MPNESNTKGANKTEINGERQEKKNNTDRDRERVRVRRRVGERRKKKNNVIERGEGPTRNYVKNNVPSKGSRARMVENAPLVIGPSILLRASIARSLRVP